MLDRRMCTWRKKRVAGYECLPEWLLIEARQVLSVRQALWREGCLELRLEDAQINLTKRSPNGRGWRASI